MKKIAKVIVAVIAVIAALFVGFFFITISYNNEYKGDFKEVLKSTAAAPAKKAIVIYQPSKHGTSAKIAKRLAEGLNSSGYEVTLSYPGAHLPASLGEYDIVAFGTPVYFGQISLALTDYMERSTDLAGKKVLIYSVGNDKELPEFAAFERSLKGVRPGAKKKFIAADTDSVDLAYKFGVDFGK